MEVPMAHKRVTQTTKVSQPQTRPVITLGLHDIDRLGEIEVRLRCLTELLADSQKGEDVYVFLRPIYKHLQEFERSLLERLEEARSKDQAVLKQQGGA
jgi:hypothetical protein